MEHDTGQSLEGILSDARRLADSLMEDVAAEGDALAVCERFWNRGWQSRPAPRTSSFHSTGPEAYGSPSRGAESTGTTTPRPSEPPRLPGESVEESFQRREAAKQARIEQLREEQRRKEDAEVRAAPRINERSLALAKRRKDSKADISERGQRAMQAVEAKYEALRREREHRELAAMRAKPKINKASKRLAGRGVDSMIKWEQQRKKRLEDKRKAAEAAEAKRNAPKRFVSKGSEAIVRKRREAAKRATTGRTTGRGGGGGGADAEAPVGERLHRMAGVYKSNKKRIARREAAKHSHNPAINPRSAAYAPKEGGNVVDRLYRGGLAKEAEKAEKAERLRQRRARVDDDGRLLFQPKLNSRSEQLAARQRRERPGGAGVYAQPSGAAAQRQGDPDGLFGAYEAAGERASRIDDQGSGVAGLFGPASARQEAHQRIDPPATREDASRFGFRVGLAATPGASRTRQPPPPPVWAMQAAADCEGGDLLGAGGVPTPQGNRGSEVGAGGRRGRAGPTPLSPTEDDDQWLKQAGAAFLDRFKQMNG